MNKLFRFAQITLACSIFACVASNGAETENKKGQSLFNGKDLTGWVEMNKVDFKVVEGNLRLVKGMGWLRTEKEYGDFILEFECCPLEEKYDSGIFFWSGLEGSPWPKEGYQVNLRYDALGGLVKGYRPIVPSETPKSPVKKWIKFRIEVQGKAVSLDVDGERAWETKLTETGKGYIGIQAEDKSFDFRNFKIEPKERK